MADDDATEREFLAGLERRFGIEDLSEAGLFKALGFDELTDEKLEQWFASEVLARDDWRGRGEARVVQVDPDDPAGPAVRRKPLPPSED